VEGAHLLDKDRLDLRLRKNRDPPVVDQRPEPAWEEEQVLLVEGVQRNLIKGREGVPLRHGEPVLLFGDELMPQPTSSIITGNLDLDEVKRLFFGVNLYLSEVLWQDSNC
jgi:hypothetical protein